MPFFVSYQQIFLYLIKGKGSSLSTHLQCSSDISELRIRVLYERILRIRVCQYAHMLAYIRAHMCVYTRVYGSLLCIPISFFM